MSDWRQRAACKSIYPDVFFPPGRIDNPQRREAVEDAIAICRPCKVRSDCAADALRRGAGHGVIAGVDLGDGTNVRILGDTERRALQKAAEAS